MTILQRTTEWEDVGVSKYCQIYFLSRHVSRLDGE